MSNSASVNGGATLFFTTLTRVRLPVTTPSVCLIAPMRRMSIADAGVEFERFAAGRRLRIAEHDADLFADLVGENATGARLRDERGEFAQRRAHQARLRADGGVADLAFQFLFRDERRDRIEHDDVERI